MKRLRSSGVVNTGYGLDRINVEKNSECNNRKMWMGKI